MSYTKTLYPQRYRRLDSTSYTSYDPDFGLGRISGGSGTSSALVFEYDFGDAVASISNLSGTGSFPGGQTCFARLEEISLGSKSSLSVTARWYDHDPGQQFASDYFASTTWSQVTGQSTSLVRADISLSTASRRIWCCVQITTGGTSARVEPVQYTATLEAAPVTATPSSPAFVGVDPTLGVTFAWTASATPAASQIQYSLDGTSWSTLATVMGSALSYTETGLTLSEGQRVYWKVRCENEGGAWGQYSDAVYFTVAYPALGVSASGPVTSGGNVTLTFSNRSGKAITAVLRHGGTTLAAPAAVSADTLSVATADSWFQTASVTDSDHMDVTVSVTASDGRTASASFRLDANTSTMKPTASGMSFAAVQPTQAMTTKFGGVYVQGYTGLKVSVSAAALLGASVTAASFTFAGSAAVAMSYNSSTGKWEGTTPVPVTANGSVAVTVTDSRGLSGTLTQSFSSVTAYSAPAVTNLSFHRCNNQQQADDGGGYCLLSATFVVSPVQNLNDKSAAVQSSIYSDTAALSAYTETKTWFFAADIEHSYEITVSAIDAINTTAVTVRLSTAGVIMDFLAGGRGIGLGKVAETANMVEVNPTWTLKAGIINLGGTDLGTLLASIQQRLTNGGL